MPRINKNMVLLSNKGGDCFYDYGKLYQSILGYDILLNNNKIDELYTNKMKEYYLNKCTDIGLNIEYLKWVTKSLVFSSFPFMKNTTNKDKVWLFMKNI